MADPRREWIWGATALVVVTALVLIMAPPPSQLAMDRRLSTFRSTPDGVGALYATLQELGVEVDRRMTPLAGVDPIRGALAMVRPTEMPSPSEIDSLFSWVDSGGRLILAGPYGDLLEGLGLALRYAPSDSALEPIAGHPWTAGLDSIPPLHRAFRLDTLRGAELRPLVTPPDSDDPVVALLPRGDGEILLVSQAFVLSNGSIGESGLAPLIARAAADWTERGDTLWFDEYHHGHQGGSPARALGSFLRNAPSGRAALQLALVGLLALAPAVVRFGSPVDRPPTPRRSRLEHVAALGEVYRQARAEEVARRRLVAGFARRIGRERPQPGEEQAFLDRLEHGLIAGTEAIHAVSEAWRDRRPVVELARRIDDAVTRINPKR